MLTIRLAWFLLEVVLLGFFFYLGSSVAFALAILLVAIPVFTLPFSLYIRKRLKIEMDASFSLRKRDNGSFLVKLENPTLFPVYRVICIVHVENQLNGGSETVKASSWLPPRRKKSVHLHVGSDYCGRLKIRVCRIGLYDLFGILSVRCKCDETGYITVQPDLFPLEAEILPIMDSVDESDVYSQERPGNDLTEMYQIREYVPGDNPRQIHWKLSSKFDKLIVRDPALPITRNILVFWERTGESGQPDVIDAQVEVLISLCHSLLEQSIQFTIGWNDTDTKRCVIREIHDMDELIGIIPRLLRAAGVKESISGAELMLKSGGDVLFGHMVYLAEEPQNGVAEWQDYGHVSMLLCGENPVEGALMFDVHHYQEQLTKIEL